jgi:Spy/CpxP family protein refolding chaperone
MRRRLSNTLAASFAMVGLLAMNAWAPQPAWADKEKESGEYEHGKGEYGEGREPYRHGKGEYGHDKGETREYGHDKESYGHGKREYGHGKGYGRGHMGMGGWHASTGHLLRHMLKHAQNIGLKEDQIAKLKEMQLNLDRTRIKSEAEIMIAERELRALVEDGKTDLSAIEAKLKQSESMEAALRLDAIKTRRDALALLTAEQRDKIKGEHSDLMPEHKVPGMRGGHGGDQKSDSMKEEGMKGHR